MLTKGSITSDARLLSYTIASADMWYAEFNLRDVYLHCDPVLGLVVRGQIPGCGSICDANLSQILLEYALTCQSKQHLPCAIEAAECFGRRLGHSLVGCLYQDIHQELSMARICDAFNLLLNSMDVPYEMELSPVDVCYELAHCPLHETATMTGLGLGTNMARRAFIALFENVSRELAPDWMLTQPRRQDADAPILEIMLTR